MDRTTAARYAVLRGEAAAMQAEELIEALELAPHPEGGWYRETWRSEAAAGERAAASAVYYVIQPGHRSRWNRHDADEIWLWHGGDPVDVAIADRDEQPARTVRLGGRANQGEQPQLVVPRGWWQSAQPAAGEAGYSFLSCIVAPAFDFEAFVIAEPGWEPGQRSTEGDR